jgi:broad specificity phosphatase PhoE
VTSFLFLRHGESTWNAVRRWQGRSDPPLSGRGEAQAVGAVGPLRELGPFDAVVTSSLQRARRTGELLAAALGLPLGTALPGLDERSAGAWEGLTRAEIEAADPGCIAARRHAPGWEDDAEVVARALAALDELARDNPDGRVLAISHGGVIHALERHVAGSDGPWQRLDNLEGRWFDHAPGRFDVVGPRVEALVDETHVPAIDEGYA